MSNLFADLPLALPAEQIEELVRGSGPWRLERIVSNGQATAPGEWYDQPGDEWVVLLSGAAGVCFADSGIETRLAPGDWLLIPAHRRHRVAWTADDAPTVWLALHGNCEGTGDE